MCVSAARQTHTAHKHSASLKKFIQVLTESITHHQYQRGVLTKHNQTEYWHYVYVWHAHPTCQQAGNMFVSLSSSPSFCLSLRPGLFTFLNILSLGLFIISFKKRVTSICQWDSESCLLVFPLLWSSLDSDRCQITIISSLAGQNDPNSFLLVNITNYCSKVCRRWRQRFVQMYFARVRK